MSDDVGYKKPPKISQFQKGKSGNPSGRPRKNRGIADLFRKISKQRVRTNGSAGQQSMTKLEASLTQLINKAATGDLKATKLFMQVISRFPELVTDPESIQITFTVVDPKTTWDVKPSPETS